MFNSFESYTSLIPDQGSEAEVETATAVFALQHTVLSALTERINLDKNPTYVTVESGCTRAMGSRYAVNRLIKAVERLLARLSSHYHLRTRSSPLPMHSLQPYELLFFRRGHISGIFELPVAPPGGEGGPKKKFDALEH